MCQWMSSPGNLSEEQVHCSICLDVFTDPVSIPCGHNFCQACILGYWKSSPLYQCPMCKKSFYKRPDTSVNTVLREIAEQFKEMRLKMDVQQLIQDRVRKVEEIKRSVELKTEDSIQVFCELVRSIQKTQADVVAAIEEKQRRIESQAHDLVAELEREIDELRRRGVDLENMDRTDHIHFLKVAAPSIHDWTHTNVPTDVSVGLIRTAVSKLESTLKQMVDSVLPSVEDVTLDPDTANPWLQLSQDRRQVRHLGAWQDLPDHPDRFDTVVIVLGREGFTSGRHYWEVQVGEKDDWYLGVAKSSVKRKGRISVSSANGYWALAMKKGQGYRVSTVPPLSLALNPKPKTVGVYVDCEEGQISFYDVRARTHLYTFTDRLSEKILPFFYLYCCDKASDTIVICPVAEKALIQQS
uniref:Nuclear factor 7, ovary-like n=1 Tax=Hippocampus comes TaxID=109280 RepID=A0A3Q2YMH6_HIPCM